MFTSRAEYRLLLRHDNADRRLAPIGRRVGSVGGAEWERFQRKEAKIVELQDYLRRNKSEGDSLATWLRRTGVEWADLCERHPALRAWDPSPDVVEQVVLEAKYAGYIDRQAAEVERFRKLEDKRIPPGFDFRAVPQLRHEAREKLTRVRPANIGQASRVSGITPADLAVLLFYLD
jgi:tRNA uridine 5-carboxymethylaminomethyl modification enzyme